MPPSEAVTKALAQLNAGRTDQAETILRRAIQKNPRDADAAHMLALVLVRSGRPDQAEYFLRTAINADPRRPDFHGALGNLFATTDRAEAAIGAFREALAIDPRHVPALQGLGFALMRTGDLTGAAEAGRRGLDLQPQIWQPWVNLSSILTQSGRVPEAIALLREARVRFPAVAQVLTNLLTALNYAPEETPETRAEAARALAPLLPKPDGAAFTNPRDPGRPLRIGFISSDLRTHSVCYFIEPILASRDRANIAVWCYSTTTRGGDETTERLKALSDGWVEGGPLEDDALVRRIRADRIDVLIDLNGHTIGNRLLALARRAAPLQATYLGYPATTGVPAIDFRIVDAVTDPARTEHLLTESAVRLEGCFVCYRPVPDAPEVAPRGTEGGVVFGSFNSMPKLNDPLIDVWAPVLRAVPGSRLILKNRALRDPVIRESVARRFADRAVEPGRLELLPPAPTQREHLAAYARVDIALDNFPYNGTTTTCEALWMGVPVVTLEGRGHAARVGASLLAAVGLPDLVARSPDDYVSIAARLASDLPALAAMRHILRERVARSPLSDAAGFTRRFEAVLRSAWRSWCVSAP